MKVSDSHHIKMAKQNLKKELENLSESHKNELEKVKNKHIQNKNLLSNNYDADLNRIQNENQKKLITRTLKNEETLNNLHNSLETVKERVSKEKNEIQSMNNDKIKADKQLFEAKIQGRRVIQQAQLDDLHHEAQTELKRLQRGKLGEKQEIEFKQNLEKKETLSGHQTKISNSKQIFDKQYHAQVDKYRNALKSQESNYQKEIVANERDHQNQVKSKTDQYVSETTKIQKDGETKISELNKNYEQKFQENFLKAQESLSKLSKRSEKLENELIAKLKENVTLEVDKDSDPFYKFQKLRPQIELDTESNSYKVRIETPPEVAKDYQLSAHGREIKIQMKRDYEFSNKDDFGVDSSVNKYESFSTKIPVDQIMDGKKITNSYADGVLTFEIKLA